MVTNAHVVAGQDDTEVTTTDGDDAGRRARFTTSRGTTSRCSASPGSAGRRSSSPRSRARAPSSAPIGYPEGGPLTITPARLGRTGTVESQDSYGRGPIERRMTPFRGEVRNGNSGGPVIDGNGDVAHHGLRLLGLRGAAPSGLGVPNDVVAEALTGPLDGARTGPCAA